MVWSNQEISIAKRNKKGDQRKNKGRINRKFAKDSDRVI
jgi:hypothetical protein